MKLMKMQNFKIFSFKWSILTARFSILALAVIFTLWLPECKKQDPATAENKIIFNLSPSGSASYQMTKNFSFHCIDTSGIPNCRFLFFMGDNGDDWMSFPQTANAASGCLDFITVVYLSGSEYTFIGQVEPLPSGVVHASGTYQNEINGGIGGTEYGTFSAACDNIKSGTAICN